MMMNAVEFHHRTHPLARFRCEITTVRAAACVPFVWGAASNLPRIRYRRAVLRPASWNSVRFRSTGASCRLGTWTGPARPP